MGMLWVPCYSHGPAGHMRACHGPATDLRWACYGPDMSVVWPLCWRGWAGYVPPYWLFESGYGAVMGLYLEGCTYRAVWGCIWWYVGCIVAVWAVWSCIGAAMGPYVGGDGPLYQLVGWAAIVAAAGLSFGSHGALIELPWGSHGALVGGMMGLPWGSRWTLMEVSWALAGLSCRSHGALTGLSWGSHRTTYNTRARISSPC